MIISGQQRIVIIGNGGAAIHAAKALRGAGFSGSIQQISDVEGAAFNPMLGPYFLKGMIPWERCFPFGPDFYRDHDIECHFGSPVEYLDPTEKTIRLADNRQFHYDKCLIATGASAVTPPIPGLSDLPSAFALRTPESTLALGNVMSKAKKVLILGASLVGIKVAEILSKKGVEVILLDVATQLLPRGAHPETSKLLEAYFEAHNIDIRLGCSVDGFESGVDGNCCFLFDEIIEEADFVAVCTGIRPNCAFLDPSLVDIRQAIVVDKYMQTTAEGLYAAGDVCQGNNPLTGKNEWLGTWNNGCLQGRVAGLNMAGLSTLYEGCIPQHISPIYDCSYAQIGDVGRQGKRIRVEIAGHPDAREGYRLCVYEDDILVGANIINRLQDLSTLKKAVTLKKSWPLDNSLPYFR
jgi:NADPH-dependent 2,4-dienoyl-CoA reductase/sulfur reductase-like enzyme